MKMTRRELASFARDARDPGLRGASERFPAPILGTRRGQIPPSRYLDWLTAMSRAYPKKPSPLPRVRHLPLT